MSVFVQGWAVQDMDKALLMVLRLEMDRKSSLLSDTGKQSCSKQDTGINIFFKAAQATASPWKVLKEQCMRCHRTQAWTVEQRQVVLFWQNQYVMRSSAQATAETYTDNLGAPD